MRKLGDITQDMEVLLTELVEEHELQHGEVLGLVFSWLQIHAPEARETYLDGTYPEYFYGWKNKDGK